MSNNTSEQPNFEELCVSSEIGRATEPYQIYSMVHLCIALLIIVSGVILLWFNRKKIWIERRNPFVLLVYVIAVLFNLAIGALYRIFLNNENSILSQCFLGNVLILVVQITSLIPNLVRVISYQNRIELNKGLSRLQAYIDGGDAESIAINRTNTLPTAPYVSTKQRTLMGSTKNTVFGTGYGSKINKLKFRASSKFANILAVTILILLSLMAVTFALLTCPIRFLGREDVCQYGFTLLGSVFVALPILPVIGIFFYYRNLSKKAPDPFRLKEEFNVFIVLAFIILAIFGLDFMNVGGLKPDKDDLDAPIGFKIIVLIDTFLLIIFVHAIHYQVYLANKYENRLDLKVPVGLDEVLKHPEATVMFKTYLETEFSVELYVVYNILVNWRRRRNAPHADGTSLDKEVRTIYKRFIANMDNSLSVNVGDDIKKPLKDIIENAKSNYPADIFDDIIDELYRLMETNGFIRFVNTEEYKVFAGLTEPKVETSRFETDY